MISLTSPIETRAHHLSAGFKLGVLCLTTCGLFFIHNLWFHSLFLLGVMTLYVWLGKNFFMAGWRHLKVLWLFVVVVAIWHVWMHTWVLGATILIRLVATVALANWVTMTTRLSDMIDVVCFLVQPLARLGWNTRALELSIALVIRMTPVLVLKGQGLAFAWRARSTKRLGWRVILPFTVLALDDADYVAEALRARGGITRMKQK